MKPPVRLAIIGMGGYAGWHHTTVAKLEERGEARLVCTCDPAAAAFASQQQKWRLGARGVGVYNDYRHMLDMHGRELDLLVVPTPIHLHAAMHRAGVERGLAVYLEKPPTLDYLELEEMIRRDHTATRATGVGFNFIVEKPRQALKQRLLAGEFGAVRETRLSAQWGRPADYYHRNNWAGRLLLDGRMVLDSCFGNAMAHFVHNMLFWAGAPGVLSWAELARVQAELYRAHAIEGADTFFVEAHTVGGIPLRFALTHACCELREHAETVVCERATLRYLVSAGAEVRWHDGRVEKTAFEPFRTLTENHLDYYRYLRGETPRPATMLTDSRPFVALNDLAHVSSGHITSIPAQHITLRRHEPEAKDYLSVAGLIAAQEQFLTRGVWPSAQGWERGAPAEIVTPDALARFHDTVRAMAAATATNTAAKAV